MKKLKGIADNLNQMVISGNAHELYRELVNLPDGVIEIDLLNATACLNKSTELKNSYITELHEWFVAMLDQECKIQPTTLSEALVIVEIDRTRLPCTGEYMVHFHAESEALIKIDHNTYKKSYCDNIWHRVGF